MKIGLISCVSGKTNDGNFHEARELYTSPLFKKAYDYAKKMECDKIIILSAKYGAIEENKQILYYDETLNGKSEEYKKEWAKKVLTDLLKYCDLKNDEFLVLAGNNYRKYIKLEINHWECPYENLSGIGYILEWLSKELLNYKSYENKSRETKK